ncbi:hypothetical protein [Parasphaerochaeta coccoides]|uniref:Uncharacterized protein n=1 Tax=Parasphaerochaeta coccoides (strain ATCC BAA-1237 / DSM 17374 / SPN1) TaxID=760011 RepID=F4GHY4_PARC1|nr:hypothetical protein [Parasphaerochaeta coccoides]AEC02097.1 hypothetical protein Spico_0873 [Parasphaerochaeta coccoides DSM 17374]
MSDKKGLFLVFMAIISVITVFFCYVLSIYFLIPFHIGALAFDIGILILVGVFDFIFARKYKAGFFVFLHWGTVAYFILQFMIQILWGLAGFGAYSVVHTGVSIFYFAVATVTLFVGKRDSQESVRDDMS